MSKRQHRKDAITLAEWCEQMSRHFLVVAAEAEAVGYKKQYLRGLRFKSKRMAQVATILRSINAEQGTT